MAQSYFWSCLTLSDNCPFFSSADPNLFYYGIGLLSFYAAFILINIADLNFNWSVDKFQSQIDHYINVVRKKVRRVQLDQQKLMSVQERTEKQRKRNEQCRRVVNALRLGLTSNDQQLCILNEISDIPDYSTARKATWSECHSVADFQHLPSRDFDRGGQCLLKRLEYLLYFPFRLGELKIPTVQETINFLEKASV